MVSGQELLRGEDGAGMHSTRSKRACASVKNPFPATNPYHNPVPKPTPRTNRAVKSAQESLKKAAGSCSGGAPDAGVGRGVPGSEECWAEAKMRVKEQLSMVRWLLVCCVYRSDTFFQQPVIVR